MLDQFWKPFDSYHEPFDDSRENSNEKVHFSLFTSLERVTVQDVFLKLFDVNGFA